MELRKSVDGSNGYKIYWATGTNCLVLSFIKVNIWKIFRWNGKYLGFVESFKVAIPSWTRGCTKSTNSLRCSVKARAQSIIQL